MGDNKKQHIHKFRRHSYATGNVVYFCALPDCNVKIKPALTLGKRAICWRCGENFIMSEYSIRLAKPHCENCHKPKASAEIPLSIQDTIRESIVPPIIIKNDSVLSEMRAKLSGIPDEDGEI